ncbi:MAG: glycine-rich protein, partial [Candidatus Cybelea sp.]
MKSSGFGRYALGVSVLVAVVTGCGGHAGGGAVPVVNAAPDSLPYHRTFHYTGKPQSFKVPAGVTKITVIAHGGNGAGVLGTYGGRVSAIIPVTPGEKLVVFVGGDGSGVNGGSNGGANGGEAYYSESPTGYGGGGASDVREHGDGLADRILVSGGGGGQGGGYPPKVNGGIGGKGGTKIGGSGGDGGSTKRNYSYYGGGGGEGGKQHIGGSGGLASDCAYSTNGANGMLLAGELAGRASLLPAASMVPAVVVEAAATTVAAEAAAAETGNIAAFALPPVEAAAEARPT